MWEKLTVSCSITFDTQFISPFIIALHFGPTVETVFVTYYCQKEKRYLLLFHVFFSPTPWICFPILNMYRTRSLSLFLFFSFWNFILIRKGSIFFQSKWLQFSSFYNQVSSLSRWLLLPESGMDSYNSFGATFINFTDKRVLNFSFTYCACNNKFNCNDNDCSSLRVNLFFEIFFIITSLSCNLEDVLNANLDLLMKLSPQFIITYMFVHDFFFLSEAKVKNRGLSWNPKIYRMSCWPFRLKSGRHDELVIYYTVEVGIT